MVETDVKSPSEAEVRLDLAAAFRFAVHERMNEGIANHFSYQIESKAEGHSRNAMIVNPFGTHFANVMASKLAKIDIDDETLYRWDPTSHLPPVDPTAICIHGAIHKLLGRRARCILHLHPHYATALSSLKDPRLLPIDQNTARFFNRLSYDDGFDGMGLWDEAERLATRIRENSAIILGNHGVLVIGETVGGALDEMYYLELAARNYITALMSGKELSILSDECAEKTAQQWDAQNQVYGLRFIAQIRELLDKREPEYKD